MARGVSGFFVIAVIVAVGAFAGWSNLMGPQARFVLNRLTYFLAGPCLVFVSLIESDLALVLSANFAVAALAALLTTSLAALLSLIFLKQDLPHAVISSVSASMVNSANMGFPIAAYVLGDVALALPVALWQMAVFTPLFQSVLHSAVAGQRPSVRALAGTIIANPMIIASAAGLAVLGFDLHLPAFIVEPIDVIAGISIPGMLLAFGMSLTASKPFSKEAGHRADILLATALKLLAMPLIAWALARWAFGLAGTELYAAVVLAALPTAQNVYVAAARYEVGEEMTRDIALLTSVGTMIALMVIASLFGA